MSFKGCYASDNERPHLHDLSEGDRFMTKTTGRIGIVRRIGMGTVTVDYEGGKVVRFKKYKDSPKEEEISFFRPQRNVTLAPCTAVEVLKE